jgi:hypothetical protein
LRQIRHVVQTFLHHLTIVPSVIVGDNDGIFTSVPGVEPPVGCAAATSLAASAAVAGAEASAGEAEATAFQSSPSSARSAMSVPTWGRWYDHNFLRFSTILGEKIGVFLRNQCFDQIYA